MYYLYILYYTLYHTLYVTLHYIISFYIFAMKRNSPSSRVFCAAIKEETRLVGLPKSTTCQSLRISGLTLRTSGFIFFSSISSNSLESPTDSSNPNTDGMVKFAFDNVPSYKKNVSLYIQNIIFSKFYIFKIVINSLVKIRPFVCTYRYNYHLLVVQRIKFILIIIIIIMIMYE